MESVNKGPGVQENFGFEPPPPPYSSIAEPKVPTANKFGDGGTPQPPPAGWVPPSHQTYGTIVVEPVPVPPTQIIVVGGCPACRIGVLEDRFSLLGVLCAIVFFPIGILCCLALRDKQCSNCGAIY